MDTRAKLHVVALERDLREREAYEAHRRPVIAVHRWRLLLLVQLEHVQIAAGGKLLLGRLDATLVQAGIVQERVLES